MAQISKSLSSGLKLLYQEKEIIHFKNQALFGKLQLPRQTSPLIKNPNIQQDLDPVSLNQDMITVMYGAWSATNQHIDCLLSWMQTKIC